MVGEINDTGFGALPSKHLVLLTESFPFGKREAFLENEIVVLAKLFESIDIVTLVPPSGDPRPLPANVSLPDFHGDQNTYSGSRILLSETRLVVKILRREYQATQQKKYFRANLRKINSSVCHAVHKANLLAAMLPKIQEKTTRIYSYWMNDWALVCSILKMKKRIPGFVFRVHGFDLYDDRQPGNYMPFRHVNMDQTDWAVAVSKKGCSYLQGRTSYPEKVSYSYLGTRDQGLAKPGDNDTLQLLSVANLIPLKGIDRIIEMLRQIHSPVNWVHYGAGVLQEELERKATALPGNITWEFRGAVSNSELMQYYHENSVDLMCLFSKSEGLPVSLMEAISFGVPVMATNVGGVSELVNDRTGVLLDEEFDVNQAIAALNDFIRNPEKLVALRATARVFWQEHFNGANNYRNFCQSFLS